MRKALSLPILTMLSGLAFAADSVPIQLCEGAGCAG